MIRFDTAPDRYRHWKLSVDGAVATLALDVAEDGGLQPGYKLKLNSYDLGVDIELHDALQRIRFEHPEIRSVVVTSGKERMFCAGANIYMLSTSSHAWKVNFCKFTNETRNGIEDASRHSGLKFIAAVNGACAGGGYHYRCVDVEFGPADRVATITVKAPDADPPGDLAGIMAEGAAWWPLAMARELDDAILMLRTNNLASGTIVLKTAGDAARVLACDASMMNLRDDWFVRETLGMLRRTLARLDVSSRSLFAVIERGSCFAGTLLELALAADRSYMLEAADGPAIALSAVNFAPFTMVNRV